LSLWCAYQIEKGDYQSEIGFNHPKGEFDVVNTKNYIKGKNKFEDQSQYWKGNKFQCGPGVTTGITKRV